MHDHSGTLDEWLDQLKPFFQPIVEVSSGAITGYEALARFVEPGGKVKSAGYLFSDQSLSLQDKRVLDQNIREKAIQCVKYLPEKTRITLNISPQWIELSSPHDLPTLEMLSKHQVDPKRVVVELMESSGDLNRIYDAVASYRKAGVRIAIDDFGAGFSQLDRVIALEPDIIKLDMRLFQQAAQGGLAESVVESLVDLCTKVGAVIVCEGVETKEEFCFGLKCGAHYMQGFLFSEATAKFLPKYAFKEQLADLRMHFYNQQRAALGQGKQSHHHLKQVIKQIEEHHASLTSLDISYVMASLVEITNLIRFYVCDSIGEQQTANYSYLPDTKIWEKDYTYKGYNWSWRPYFYQLSSCDKMIVSDSYLDMQTAKACRTYSIQLNDAVVLMVDVESSSI